MICWDTSAFARTFLRGDPGYGQARSLLVGDHRHAGSTLLWPETASALVRRARAKGAKRGFDVGPVRLVLERFELVDVSSPVAEEAFHLVERFALTGSDAAHLATAIAMSRAVGRRSLVFAASDRDLAAAARAVGLRAVSPGL